MEEGGLVLEAACDIPRGTPITMCYGRGMDSTVLEQLHGQALKAESPAPGGIEAAPGAGGG